MPARRTDAFPAAAIRTGVAPDRLVLIPRDRGDKHRLHATLRSRFPTAKWELCAEGVAVHAFDAIGLVLDHELALTWSDEAMRVVLNRQRVLAHHADQKAAVDAIVSAGASSARERIARHVDVGVLDPHQQVNVACMTLDNGFGLCVFDEQGAGKTVTTIFAFDALVERNLVDFLFIVAPKSMVAEWHSDFSKFLGDRYDVQVVAGAFKTKKAALASRADVLVTNFETAVSMEDGLRNLLAGYGGKAVLVVDESFYAKNLDAQRTLALRRLREWCGRAFVLCGTPAPNSPHDLIQQFNIVDFGVTFLGADIPDDKTAARPVIQRLIKEKGLYVRHQKRLVLPDLPPKTFHRAYVPLEPKQAKLYASALNSLITDLRGTDEQSFQREIVSFLARRSALLQVCSNPVAVAKGYSETPAKLLALDDLLTDRIEQANEKVIVWSFYTASIGAIFTRFQKYNPVRYDGTVSDIKERREAVRRFQKDDNTMLFVANPAAAGAGLTLHRSRVAIYESWSNQAAHYLQSLDRIHRRGQTRDVEYVILLCENTIEEDEYARLIEKEKSAALLLGDGIDAPLTREGMLAEFLAAKQRMSGRRRK